MARTQQQRRDETVARLLDASIATIVEIGYARASAAVITKRAGVSVGALFRHFDTMGDFMAATAHEVLRRLLDEGSKRVADVPADKMGWEALLGIVRDITRNPTNTVMYELMIAARTDEKLRSTLQDVLIEYGTKIYDVVRALPGSENVPDETLAALVATLINTFDGAAIVRAVVPHSEIDAQQIPLLASLLEKAYG
ncbi:MAG TPA: TetR/AcrR family transcriptional regulator [Mycobacterium sp.]|nr:TetR/AcrR family transcriptional regulator [Mycobacterium sp.]